jgi:hypothetical protein
VRSSGQACPDERAFFDSRYGRSRIWCLSYQHVKHSGTYRTLVVFPMLDPSGSTSMLTDLPPIDVETSVQLGWFLDRSLIDVRYLHDDVRRIPCRRLPIMLVQIAFCRRVRQTSCAQIWRQLKTFRNHSVHSVTEATRLRFKTNCERMTLDHICTLPSWSLHFR